MLVGIHLEARHVVDILKQQVSFDTVQYSLSVLFEGVGNALLVSLLVLYLLAEQSAHAPGSLRAKVDSQIQRYVVIKTAISALQGLLAYFIMGPLLNVRMAHLFGVLHFLLNYIPTAGPVVATGAYARARGGAGCGERALDSAVALETSSAPRPAPAVLPLPVVVLDPDLSVTAKIAAFAGPTAVHMVRFEGVLELRRGAGGRSGRRECRMTPACSSSSMRRPIVTNAPPPLSMASL